MNERFSIVPGSDLMWTIKDNESGFAVTFREGLFNETQEVTAPEKLPDIEGEPALWAARIMREIGDYVMEECPDIALCDPDARTSAIWCLANEKYWITMADACNSLLIDFEVEQAADHLLAEMEDYFLFENGNPAKLNEAEKHNLLGSIFMLDGEEANEVFSILLSFWKFRNQDIQKWASDVLWWPMWAEQALPKDDDEEEEEEEED